jgi:DNA-binding MarR family transcriptional regulator
MLKSFIKFLKRKGELPKMNRTETITPNCAQQNLGELFHRAAMSMKRALHHQGHSHHAQEHVLSMLSETGSLSQGELRQSLHVRSASLSELLSKLEKHGLVSRSRHPHDHRNVVITITEAGLGMAQRYGDMWQGPEARELFASLSEQEQYLLESILNKLIGAWEEKYGQAGHAGKHHCSGYCGRPSGRGQDPYPLEGESE